MRGRKQGASFVGLGPAAQLLQQARAQNFFLSGDPFIGRRKGLCQVSVVNQVGSRAGSGGATAWQWCVYCIKSPDICAGAGLNAAAACKQQAMACDSCLSKGGADA